jgi:hypothetical protein
MGAATCRGSWRSARASQVCDIYARQAYPCSRRRAAKVGTPVVYARRDLTWRDALLGGSMDPTRFDRLAVAVAADGTRRGLLRFLAAASLGLGLDPDHAPTLVALAADDDHGSSHRRRRRRTRHKHDRNTVRRNKPNKRNKPNQPNVPPPPPSPRCPAGADLCQDFTAAICGSGNCFCMPRKDGTGAACIGAQNPVPAQCNCTNDAACATFGSDWVCVTVSSTGSQCLLLPSDCGGPVTSICQPPCAGGA